MHMSAIEFDVRMRFIDEETRCYILFPGRGYTHYFDMDAEGIVYLDFPGIPLKKAESIDQIVDWEARITVSDRIRRWFAQGQDLTDLPPRTTRELGNFRSSQRKRLFAGLLKSFFLDIKKGDVIVVPPAEQDGDVLFGEIIDIAEDFIRHKHPYFSGETVPARRVRWVSRVKRRDVPRWLDAKLPSPNPLRLIGRSYYAHIFDLAYERYHYLDKYVCKFHVSSQHFDALTNLDLQQFILLPTALHYADKNPESDSLYRLIRRNVSRESAPDQRIEINSPGHIVLIAKNAAPFITAILLILTSDSYAKEAKPKEVKIANSNFLLQSKIEKQCLIDMEIEVQSDLVMMNKKQWQEACELDLASKEGPGLKTGVQMK